MILASDKTQLSNFSGDKAAWPVYLTIGNIDKATRRSPSSRATVLIGYLPVSKLEHFSSKNRSIQAAQLFHDCMGYLLAPLVRAGLEGVDMPCADGCTRRVFPIVAAYIADHPEQCLIACCKENHCPKCLVPSKKRGDTVEYPLRDPKTTATVIEDKIAGKKTPQFTHAGLKEVHPFWANLPHCNIFECITPDILHQLHKGVFKDHTVGWATACVEAEKPKDEVDNRFKAMTAHPDLRYFRKGVSLVSQWTGTEYKNMEKVFLTVVAGAAEEKVVRAVRGVLDFIYFAHFETHTDESLHNMEAAFKEFHRYKHVFLDRGVRGNFEIPKIHSMIHYVRSIQLKGTADGYSTEATERLHIDFAKVGYRASNHKEYVSQMTRWLDRQEKVRIFDAYLAWRGVGQAAEDEESEDGDDEDEEGDKNRAVIDVGTAESKKDNDQDEQEEKLHYTIAKKAPLRMSVDEVDEKMGAPNFGALLEDYLRSLSTSARHRHSLPNHDKPDILVFKQFKITLPVMGQVSRTKPEVDTIRAVAAHPLKSRPFETVPEQFSTVLVRDKRMLELAGIRVGKGAELPRERIPEGERDNPFYGAFHASLQ